MGAQRLNWLRSRVMRVPDRLLPLLDDGLIEDVVRPLMSGKEANVYIVATQDGYCVAKVYKEAENRSFRQRAAYTDGRHVRSSRQRRAMEKGSRFGKEQEELAWHNAEVDALNRLHDAGVRVPRPHIYTSGVLLMDLLLDRDGEPAPRFCDVDFTADEAHKALVFVMQEVAAMLCAGYIHGDLSEYNVLMAWDGPVIIDLPQVIHAAHSQSARQLLVRDTGNITRFLSRFSPWLADARFGEEMWSLYERALLAPDTELTGIWRPPNRRVDVRGVLREVEHAAAEGQRRSPKRRSGGPGR